MHALFVNIQNRARLYFFIYLHNIQGIVIIHYNLYLYKNIRS